LPDWVRDDEIKALLDRGLIAPLFLIRPKENVEVEGHSHGRSKVAVKQPVD
jgi:hypothetical protein